MGPFYAGPSVVLGKRGSPVMILPHGTEPRAKSSSTPVSQKPLKRATVRSRPSASIPTVRANSASVLADTAMPSESGWPGHVDRKSVVEGKSVSVRVDLGGRRIIKKKKNKKQY